MKPLRLHKTRTRKDDRYRVEHRPLNKHRPWQVWMTYGHVGFEVVGSYATEEAAKRRAAALNAEVALLGTLA